MYKYRATDIEHLIRSQSKLLYEKRQLACFTMQIAYLTADMSFIECLGQKCGGFVEKLKQDYVF